MAALRRTLGALLNATRKSSTREESSAFYSSLAAYVEQSAIGAPAKRKGSHMSPAPPLLKTILDGKVAEVLAHGAGGTFVGEDYNGNRYFERPDGQAGRSRWVVYSGAAHHYENQNPTTIPPEWHSWLHYMSDENPMNSPAGKKPVFLAAAREHPSYEKQDGVGKYLPKGAWAWNKKGGRRNWRKFQAWTP